eukprot:COSAG02_NODE_5458_length_4302_cov_1.659291_2_plen_75_part_00
MLAMALLPHGGLLGGMGGEAAGVDGSGEGAWTLATPVEGFLAALGTGELAHLLHLCLSSHQCASKESDGLEIVD